MYFKFIFMKKAIVCDNFVSIISGLDIFMNLKISDLANISVFDFRSRRETK